MPRGHRMEDVSCAICIEPLFSKLNDLDEVCHTAAPDCGHVFHEDCLQQWFKAQTDAYLRNARLHDNRATSPTASEAPVECPTCRKECYADEDGEPRLRRLFINLPSESQAGSSPMRPTASQAPNHRTQGDKVLMACSRRAKGLGEEVKALTVESEMDEVDGTLRRVGRLTDDMVSLKSIQGVKTYVGGLATALATFRSTLETHPTIPQLQIEIKNAKESLKKAKKAMNVMETITVPMERQAAVNGERVKWENRIQTAEGESAKLRQELRKEQVALKVSQKSFEDKDREMGMRIKQLNAQVHDLQARVKELSGTLDERSKVLKAYQTRMESRKELRTKNEELQAEIDRLKAQAASSHNLHESQRRYEPAFNHEQAQTRGTRRDSETAFEHEGDSIEYCGDTATLNKRPRLSSSAPAPADESLSIEMPNTDISFDVSTAKNEISRHPTARTITFDRTSGLLPSAPKKKSKYFSSDMGSDPSKTERSSSDILVAGSSSPVRPSPPPRLAPSASAQIIASKRTKTTNPFATSRAESEKRKKLKSPTRSASIDLTGETPERRPLANRQVKNTDGSSVKSVSSKVSSNAKGSALTKNGQGSLVEFLGIADQQGRPKKGVVSGEKVKRRA